MERIPRDSGISHPWAWIKPTGYFLPPRVGWKMSYCPKSPAFNLLLWEAVSTFKSQVFWWQAARVWDTTGPYLSPALWSQRLSAIARLSYPKEGSCFCRLWGPLHSLDVWKSKRQLYSDFSICAHLAFLSLLSRGHSHWNCLSSCGRKGWRLGRGCRRFSDCLPSETSPFLTKLWSFVWLQLRNLLWTSENGLRGGSDEELQLFLR